MQVGESLEIKYFLPIANDINYLLLFVVIIFTFLRVILDMTQREVRSRLVSYTAEYFKYFLLILNKQANLWISHLIDEPDCFLNLRWNSVYDDNPHTWSRWLVRVELNVSTRHFLHLLKWTSFHCKTKIFIYNLCYISNLLVRLCLIRVTVKRLL